MIKKKNTDKEKNIYYYLLNYHLKKKYMHYWLQISIEEAIVFVKKNHQQYWHLKFHIAFNAHVDILGSGSHLN